MDLTTNPPTLWVVWRHQSVFPYGGCIRGGQYFDADGRIWWNHGDGLPHDTDAQSISNMIEESIGVGQGGLFVQAGDGVVSVVYDDAGDYGTATPCCPADGLKGVGLGIVSTPTSNLTDWSLAFDPALGIPSLFFHSDTYEYCTVNGNRAPGSDTGTISVGWKNFSFVRDPTRGYYYVAFNDSKSSIRIFRSTSQGVYWDELCGDTAQWFSQASPAGRKCAVPAIGGTPADPPSVFQPALAVDPNGWLAIANYQSDPSDTLVQEVFRARTMTGNVEGPWQPAGLHGAATTLTNFVFVPQSGNGPACAPSRTLGEYQYMAAETHPFLVGTPLCPASVNFQPAWTGIIPSTGGVTIQTAQVSVSP